MKNYLTLFALAAAMMFAACSDSDDEPAWKQLPTEPISGDNVALTVNGGSTSGSVQLTATGATQGTLLLTNVLPGYAEISMDVTLSERADGSFDITGEKGLTTAPSMISRAAAEPVIFNISISGNITPGGNAVVNLASALSTEAQGGLAGTWKLTTDIQYNDAGDGFDKVAVLLKWTASGDYNKTANAVCLIEQMWVPSLLVEFLNDVTFHEDGNITARYGDELPEVEGVEGTGVDKMIAWAAQAPNWVWDEPEYFAPINTRWKTSPKNLAFWYVKEGLLYIVPNIANILGQVSEDTGTEVGDSLDMTQIDNILSDLGINLNDPDVQALLPVVMQWLSNGNRLNIPSKMVA